MTEEMFKDYFKSALILVDPGKVKQLFKSLGYAVHDTITPEMCLQAINEHGVEFSKPLFELIKMALKTPRVKSYSISQIKKTLPQ